MRDPAQFVGVGGFTDEAAGAFYDARFTAAGIGEQRRACIEFFDATLGKQFRKR
jgi:hypothetical protein